MNFTIITILLFFTLESYGQQKIEQSASEIRVTHFEKHSCENVTYPSSKNLYSHINGDTLEIKLQVIDNCNIDFVFLKANFNYKEDSLNLFYEKINPKFNTEKPFEIIEPIPEAECDCQFLLDYKLIGWKDKIKPSITFFNKLIPLYKGFEVIEHDTLNRIDSLGKKQGKWLFSLNDYESYEYKFDYFENDKKIKSEQFRYETIFEKDPNTDKLKKYLYMKVTHDYRKETGTTIFYLESGIQKFKSCYLLSDQSKAIPCE